MSTEKSSRDDVAAETARLGAMLAGKGLTPDQVATLMRDEVQPVLTDAVRRVETGATSSAMVRARIEAMSITSAHSMRFHIRRASLDDCVSILEACEADVVDFETRDLLSGALPFPIFLALDTRGTVVGALEGDFFCKSGDGWAWVFNIGVAEYARRHGVGTALLRAFSEAALRAGRTHVALRIQDGDGMEVRRVFFRRCGLSSPDDDDTLAIGVLADLE